MLTAHKLNDQLLSIWDKNWMTRMAPRAAAGQRLFSVAQIVNLLYRRLAIGTALVEVRRSGRGTVLQDGILRYSRLAVCATNMFRGSQTLRRL